MTFMDKLTTRDRTEKPKTLSEKAMATLMPQRSYQ